MRRALLPTLLLVLVAVHAARPARVDAQAAQPKLDYQTFVTQIEPIFLKKRPDHARCYVCHSVSTPFRLQPLSPGATTWDADQSEQNFVAVRRLVVPGNPAASKLLLMPLAEEAGGTEFHPGGKHFMSLNDPESKTIAAWILAAK
jgi:uncharacterized membrane protein